MGVTDNWRAKGNNKTRITAAEMKYIGRTFKFIKVGQWKKQRCTKITKSRTCSEQNLKYKSVCVHDIDSMQRAGLPRLLYDHKQHLLINRGQHLKRLLNDLYRTSQLVRFPKYASLFFSMF
jgi:hypothetical protein